MARPSALREVVNERATAVEASIRKARVIRVLLRHALLHEAIRPERYSRLLARIGA